MAKMNIEQRMVFLHYVADCVAADPTLMRDVMSAMTEGLQKRLDEANQMRVDAEVSVSWLLGVTPKSALEREPGMAVKAKKVVVNSGMFSGTTHASELAKEIMVGEEVEKLDAEDAKRMAEDERKARDQRLRDNREKERQRKKPVSTISASDVCMDVAAGNSTLKPFRIANGDGPYSLHGWALVVNEPNPVKPQEPGYLYVGTRTLGRDMFATEADANEAIKSIVDIGNVRMKDEVSA